MSDKEIFDIIEQKNVQVIKSVEGLITGYTSSITTLITTENQNIKHSVDQLTIRVERQNGSVRELKQWKEKHTGEETGEEKAIKRHDIADSLIQNRKRDNWYKVLTIIGICTAIYFGFKNNKKATVIQATTTNSELKLDNLGIPMETVTRGQAKDTVRLFYFPNDSRRFRMIIERDTLK